MGFPKYILVSRSLLKENPEAVSSALRIFYLGGVVVSCPEDAVLGQCLSDNVVAFDKPIALIADFPETLRVINDDGSVEEMAQFEEDVVQTPMLRKMN